MSLMPDIDILFSKFSSFIFGGSQSMHGANERGVGVGVGGGGGLEPRPLFKFIKFTYTCSKFREEGLYTIQTLKYIRHR